MQPLSDINLLIAWERGLALPPVRRPLALLLAAGIDVPMTRLARLSVGQRNAMLLALRRSVFGSALAALSACLKCGARVELEFAVEDVLGGGTADVNAITSDEPPQPLRFVTEGYELIVRLPDTDDLTAASSGHETELAPGRRLLALCLLDARRDGTAFAARDLPESVVAALAKHLSEADPQADVQVSLKCPDCGGEWREAFDIGSFFWTELDAWAVRLLGDVHRLARAYGWSEADILAMTPHRRNSYLELAAR